MKKIASAVVALLFFQMFGALPQAAVALSVCDGTNQFTIEAKHNPEFYRDSRDFDSNYVQFKITNKTGAPITGYYARIENFTGSGKLSVAAYETETHAIITSAGSNIIDTNGSVNLYWYLTSSGTTNSNTNFDVAIYSGVPSVATEVCKVNSTISKVDNTISANANKLTSVIYSSLPSPSATGSETLTATVKGQTGTIGAGPSGNRDVNLSPATSANFDASRFRLAGTSYKCGTSTPVLNQLYIPNACSGNYVAVFTYQYLQGTSSNASASAVLSPIMQIASGSQIKHTSTPSFTVATIGSTPVNQVTTNAATYIYSSSSTLNGTIDYGTYTLLYFCYSSTNPGANFTNSNCTNKVTAVNDGNGNITANLTGLTNNTTYYFELTGENSGPTYTKGGVLNFLAKATATTNNASSVADTSATLNGVQSGVAAADVDTTATLFYYTTTNPGSGHVNLSTSDTASVVATSSNTVFTANLTGLSDGTTYYFEIVLIDINSQSFIGGVKSFTTPGRFTVTFDSNTATSGAPEFGSVRQSASNTDVTLATEGTLAKTGYTFQGWNLNRGGTGTNYDTATAYRPSSNITLYAKWVANPGTGVTITFDPNSGTLASGLTSDTGTVTSGGDALTVKPGTDPTRTGYTFKGWNTDINATAGLSSPVTANSDLTLYAIWEIIPSGGGGGGSSPAPYVPKPPTINSISAPEVCAVSSQLVIKGTNLGSATVTVDGVNARILAASSNEISLALPSASVGIKTITVTNDDGSATTTVKYSFADTPIFTNFSYPETYRNHDFKYTFSADAAAKYEITGLAPSGLSINPLTGELSGAPTQEGNFVFAIVASNICESSSLIVYMFVDKEIPNAFTCAVAFNNPRSDAISDIKLANLRTCLGPVPSLTPKYVKPVIFLSGGIPAGLTADQALTHPRYLPIIALIESMNLDAQIYFGAFSGSTDSVQLNVYWPDPA